MRTRSCFSPSTARSRVLRGALAVAAASGIAYLSGTGAANACDPLHCVKPPCMGSVDGADCPWGAGGGVGGGGGTWAPPDYYQFMGTDGPWSYYARSDASAVTMDVSMVQGAVPGQTCALAPAMGTADPRLIACR